MRRDSTATTCTLAQTILAGACNSFGALLQEGGVAVTHNSQTGYVSGRCTDVCSLNTGNHS